MLPLAKYTLLESLRDKIYLGFLAVLVGLCLLLAIVGSTPWGLENYVIERLIWMATDIMLGIEIAIYSVYNIYRERDRRILYSHLTLPLGRTGYLLGKVTGLAVTIFVLAAAGALIALVSDRLLSHLHSFRWTLFWMIPSVVMKSVVVLSFGVLLSQIATSSLTASLFTLGVYFIGNGADEFLRLAGNLQGAFRQVVTGVYYVVPNLQLLDLQHAAIYGGDLGIARLGSALAYMASYTAAALVFACLLFDRKDL